MFVQPKSDGRIRPLVDLRLRNQNTIKDHSPIPNQQVILNSVGRAKYRSKIDLSDAYFQTRVHPEDEKYNTIKTPFGAFACKIMLQGDTNAPATFMRVMEDTLSEYLGDFVWVYLDDILIFSETPSDHIRHVDLVCRKLKGAQLYASPKKSVFFADKLEILGHIIDDNGIHPAPEKIRKISDWTTPKNKKELERFNGIVNYVSQFLPHIATIAAPLTELTGKAEWEWTALHDAAFNQVKLAADDKRILTPLDYSNLADPIWLFTDASLTGTGAWVGQGPTPESAKPASFHSKKLTPTQTNYPTHQQEALAIVEAVKAFDHLLAGTKFTIVTDHQSLRYMMTQKSLGERQQRWANFLNRYEFEIQYRRGKTNYLADALSRLHEDNSSSTDLYLQDPTETTHNPPTITDDQYSAMVSSASSLEPMDDEQLTQASQLMNEVEEGELLSEQQQMPPITAEEPWTGTIYGGSLASYLTTRAQKRKQDREKAAELAESSSPPAGPEHASMSWTACYDDNCPVHLDDKLGENWFPKKRRRSTPSKRSSSSPPRTSPLGRVLESSPPPPGEQTLYPQDMPPTSPTADITSPISDTREIIPPPAADSLPDTGRAEEIVIAGQLLDVETTLLGSFKDAMLRGLRKDPLYQRALDSSKSGKHYWIADGILKVTTTSGPDATYIPEGRFEKGVSLREYILSTVHDRLGHFSAAKCYRYAIAFFWWPQMRSDFTLYIRSCDKCQKNKEPTTLPGGDPLTLPIPTEAYQSLAVDFAGPFPKSMNFESIFVIMDRFTSYTHLVPVTTNCTAAEAFELLQKTVFDIHGRPLSIVMDQDPRFTSRFFQQTMKSLSIEIWMATQYHHQTNGQVERRIRTIKQMMRNYVNKRQNDWCQALPKIAAAINGAPHESLGMSPYQALYGRPYRVLPPLTHSNTKVPAADDIIDNHEATRLEVEQALNHARFRQTVQAQKRRNPQPQWDIGQRVLIYGKAYNPPKGRSRKLQPRWFGPFAIKEFNEDTEDYKLDLGYRYRRQKPWFHVSVLKQYHENDDTKFPTRRFTRPEPMIIDNEPEWEVESILDHRTQQNRHEFLIHWKDFPTDDDSWEPIENLEGAQELIAEYWETNGEAGMPIPTISTHYVRQSWGPMEVSIRERQSQEDVSDFWDPYDDAEYESYDEDMGFNADELYGEDYFETGDLGEGNTLFWSKD
jgi:transposase InsO family protein